MGTLFLQDTDSTILVADIRDFSALAKAKARGGAVELAITLSRFYEHVAAAAKAEGGRVVKLCGDGVLCAFVGVPDHRQRGLRAVGKLVASRDQVNEMARMTNMPVIDYTVVLGSGRVLAGDIGAEKLQGFDVIGEVVNRAFRLSQLATRRGVSNLVEASAVEPVPAGERPAGLAPTDPIDFDGESLALFSLPA